MTRIILQIHQLIDLLISNGLDLTDKKFLDIGTGNGLIPRLLLSITRIKNSIGIDPYLDGEHLSSWQPHNRDLTLSEIIRFINQSNNVLDYSNYSKFNTKESSTQRPAKYQIPNINQSKNYKFEQIGAHELSNLIEPRKWLIFWDIKPPLGGFLLILWKWWAGVNQTNLFKLYSTYTLDLLIIYLPQKLPLKYGVCQEIV